MAFSVTLVSRYPGYNAEVGAQAQQMRVLGTNTFHDRLYSSTKAWFDKSRFRFTRSLADCYRHAVFFRLL